MKSQKRSDEFFDTNFKEIISSEIVLLFGGLLAGSLLAFYTDQILIIPGMLIILPGFLEMMGNINGSFTARLVSGLFLKIIKPTTYKSRIVKDNIAASFILAISLSFLFGFILFSWNWIIGGTSNWALILLPLIAGIISNVLEIPLALMATFYLFKKGHDPNNVMGPFITISGDVISIAALIIAFFIIL